MAALRSSTVPICVLALLLFANPTETQHSGLIRKKHRPDRVIAEISVDGGFVQHADGDAQHQATLTTSQTKQKKSDNSYQEENRLKEEWGGDNEHVSALQRDGKDGAKIRMRRVSRRRRRVSRRRRRRRRVLSRRRRRRIARRRRRSKSDGTSSTPTPATAPSTRPPTSTHPPASTRPPTPTLPPSPGDPRGTEFGLMLASDGSGDVFYKIDATKYINWISARRDGGKPPGSSQNDFCSGTDPSNPCIWLINQVETGVCGRVPLHLFTSEAVNGCDNCHWPKGGRPFSKGTSLGVPAKAMMLWGSLNLGLQLDANYWVRPVKPVEKLPPFTAPILGKRYKSSGSPPAAWPMGCRFVDGLHECQTDNSAAWWGFDFSEKKATLEINSVDRISLQRGQRRSFLGDLVDLAIQFDSTKANVYITFTRNEIANKNMAFWPAKGCCGNWGGSVRSSTCIEGLNAPFAQNSGY